VGLLLALVACSGGGSAGSGPPASSTTPAAPVIGETAPAPVEDRPTAAAGSTTTAPVAVEVGGERETGARAASGAPTAIDPQSTARPGLTSLSAPASAGCIGEASTTVHLAWSFSSATSVAIYTDGRAEMGSLPSSGSTAVRFPCDGDSHTYFLRASGPGGTATASASIASR